MCQFRRFGLERTTVHEKPGRQPPTPVTQTVPSRHAPTKNVTDNVPSKHANASNLALSLGENNFPQQVGKQRPTSVTQTELEENNAPRRQGKQHQASVTRHLANKYALLTGKPCCYVLISAAQVRKKGRDGMSEAHLNPPRPLWPARRVRSDALVTALQSGRGLKTTSYRTHAEPISDYAVFPRPE